MKIYRIARDYTMTLRQQEKQKENKFAPQVLPCSAAWFEDGDEKQKEQKPLTTEETELNSIAFLEQMGYTCIPPRKEQKPAELSEVELEFRGEKVKVKRPFFRDDKGRGYSTTEQDEDVAWNALRAWCEKKGISLYDLYPKVEWSEEDDEMIDCIIDDIREAKRTSDKEYFKELCDKEMDWLKSLSSRPKSSDNWKPSKEQMEVLLSTQDMVRSSGYQQNAKVLASIYEQLEKLI